MKLDAYLSENALTEEAFAALVGTDRSTVNRWRTGGTTPEPANQAKIFEATRGRVAPNDFIDLPELEPNGAA